MNPGGPLLRLFNPVLCLLSAVLVTAVVSAQESLPPGWRKPVPSEVKGAWRSKSRARFLSVKGDFDGDGRADLAEILVSASGKKCSLFVRLSSENGRWQSVHDLGGGPGEIGIDLVKPGKYETLCYADPSICAPDAPQVVNLTTDAIGFFSYGSTSSFFFFDSSTKEFRAAARSD
jgi:hypothetical protein